MMILNNSFSIYIITLLIPQNVYSGLSIGDTDDPILRAIVKYPKHPKRKM